MPKWKQERDAKRNPRPPRLAPIVQDPTLSELGHAKARHLGEDFFRLMKRSGMRDLRVTQNQEGYQSFGQRAIATTLSIEVEVVATPEVMIFLDGVRRAA